MPLEFRTPKLAEFPLLEDLIIESFEPITWFKKVDREFGPLNGRDWRDRWRSRLRHAFATEIMVVGEADGEIQSYASGSLDEESALAYIDLVAVRRGRQGRGHGRATLRAILNVMRERGALYAHLDCLTDNEAGNALYISEGFHEVMRQARWFKKL